MHAIVKGHIGIMQILYVDAFLYDNEMMHRFA